MFKYFIFIYHLIRIQCIVLYELIYLLFFGVSNPHYTLSKVNNYFGCKYTGQINKISEKSKVYLFNHVGFADFFIDYYIVGGNSCYISRYIILFVLPISSLYSLLTKICYFFKRKKGSKDNVTKIISTIVNKYNKKVILYPEGTRNPNPSSILQLRKGGLNIIYDLNLPLQIININNKNLVVNEKKAKMDFNVACNVLVSNVIYPNKYNSFDDFYDYIILEWKNIFTNNINYNYNNIENIKINNNDTIKLF